MSGSTSTTMSYADPAEIRDVFLRRGWRGLERNYGTSNAVLMQAIERAGGKALLAERAAAQTAGRRAGGGNAHGE